jgi:hypothetical protein
MLKNHFTIVLSNNSILNFIWAASMLNFKIIELLFPLKKHNQINNLLQF